MFRKQILFTAVVLFSQTSIAEVLEDPTMPPGYMKPGSNGVAASAQETSGSLKVTAIQLSAKAHSAVINSEKVRIGDSISGARVLRIEPNKVVVDLKGERRELPLIATEFKQKVMPGRAFK